MSYTNNNISEIQSEKRSDIQLHKVSANSSYFYNKKAIISNSGYLTYGKLISCINEYSLYLKSKCNSEEIIGIFMNRQIDMIISILSVLNSGCAFLPLNPSLPKSRLKYLIENSNVRKVITHEKLRDDLSHLNIEILTLDNMRVENKSKNQILIQPSHLAYLMYTSGSTGNPKGVLVEHKSLDNIFTSVKETLKLNQHDIFLALTDFTFDISLLELILPITIGATVVIAEEGSICNGEKIKFYINTYMPTVIQATPLTWDILLKSGWKNDGSIKLISGGEVLNVKLAQKLNPRFRNIWNMYGPTETTIWSTIALLNSTNCTFTTPIGFPVKNTKIYILDENLNDVSYGEVGELYIGGIGLARGYHNNKELTNKQFIIHPILNERIYKTGDLVKQNQHAELVYIGRADDQIKVGGIRLEPKEIETCVESLECIKKAVLIKKTDLECSKQLILYVEINENICARETACDNFLANSWKSAYNTVYREFINTKENLYLTPGWVSAFKGKSLNQKELDESIKFIVAIVRGLNHPSILEIGCGVGNVTLKLIDYARQYIALDSSEEAIGILSKSVCKEQKMKLTLNIGFANNINNSISHDCIIMHSVAQYFPSSNYFEDVLSKLIHVTNSNGTIIISDLRSPALLDIFLLEKISHDVDFHNTASQEKIYFKNRDNELLIDPYYFYTLPQMYDSVSHVDISIRNGSYENELNSYRYDILIHIKKPVEYKKPIEIHWNDILKDESCINSFNKYYNNTIRISGIPNIPVINKINRLSEIFSDITSELMLPKKYITDPEMQLFNTLINIETTDHYLFTKYENTKNYLELEMYLNPKNLNYLIRADKKIDKNSRDGSFFREPFNLQVQKIIFDKIATKLNNEIPKCIQPSTIIWIEKWPTMINGKINKIKLSKLNTFHDTFISNKISASIYSIWFEITGNNLSIDDNLFYSGMSSLYAHYFLATICEKFSINITFQEIMMNPSIRELANFIQDKMNTKSRCTRSVPGKARPLLRTPPRG